MPPVPSFYKKNGAAKRRKTTTGKRKSALVKSIGAKDVTIRGPSNTYSGKMLYSDTYTLNPGVAGAAAYNMFRIQSIYDPDFTGVGHQAMGYDQLSPIWERYIVTQMDFEVEFLNTDVSNQCGVGYYVTDENKSDTDPRKIMEQGGGEWALLDKSLGPCKKRWTGTVYPHQVHGTTYSRYMGNPDFAGVMGSNPSEETFFVVWADGIGADTGTVDVRVRLTYHVKLKGSKLLALS